MEVAHNRAVQYGSRTSLVPVEHWKCALCEELNFSFYWTLLNSTGLKKSV